MRAERCACLLLNVNFLLMMFVGAALSTGARLVWDPSLYVVVRALLGAAEAGGGAGSGRGAGGGGTEYRALLLLLPAGALLLLLLALLALHAVHCTAAHSATRRTLLLLYAAGMWLLVCAEVGGGVWAAGRVRRLVTSQEARRLRELLQRLRAHVGPLLDALIDLDLLPHNVRDLIQEASEDLPRNGYCAAGAVAALLLLQAAAVLLALLARRCAAPRAPRPFRAPLPLTVHTKSLKRTLSCRGAGGEEALPECRLIARTHAHDTAARAQRQRHDITTTGRLNGETNPQQHDTAAAPRQSQLEILSEAWAHTHSRRGGAGAGAGDNVEKYS